MQDSGESCPEGDREPGGHERDERQPDEEPRRPPPRAILGVSHGRSILDRSTVDCREQIGWLAVVTSVASAGFPYIHLGALHVGIPIQPFGVIVAAGVLVGASLLQRYGKRRGVDEPTLRGLTTWIIVSGFLGAHLVDVIAYQPQELVDRPWVLLELWDGISSYGGFIGGAIGFALYVRSRKMPVSLMADIAIVGLLPAFSIGRIACSLVSDHIGAATDPGRWYAFLAMDYPRRLNLGHLADHYPGTSEMIRAWNLGLVELLYLIPINALILALAFRRTKPLRPGLLATLTAVLYAPVRFFLEFLRPEDTDPTYFGFTFAQWASLMTVSLATYLLIEAACTPRKNQPGA